MRTRRLYALFGLLATLLGVAAGHFVASLLNPASSPVLAVGSAVIDLTPTPVKEWAIAQFGTKDKPILIGSVLLGVLVLAAVAGVVARRRFRDGAIILMALVAVPVVAVLTRPTVEALDLVPAVVTAATGLGALWLLDSRARGVPGTEGPELPGVGGEAAAGPTRRGVVIAMGALAAAAAALGGTGRWIQTYRARAESIDLPAAADAARPLSKGLDDQVPGITRWITPNEDFYRVDTRLDTPVVNSEDWTLTIDGDVTNELTITFDELLEMPMIERDITLTCVSNSVGGEFVGGARWLGVPLQDLLDRAGVGSEADQILSTDFDGMTISTPLALATDGRDAMICVGMNGEQLPRAHGFPVRMVIPGLYGFISATKWLTKLTLTSYEQQEAYWTERDWATDAPIKISARIDTPRALAELDAGENVVGGIAWCQHSGGVGSVEVQVDGGGWQPATLGPDGGNDYWRQWYYRWDAEPGQHSIAARVTSGDGQVQTAARATPFPEGASGIHQYTVTVS
jgi:DMSO/TMAO reductase YedYZ molybdopterin-dependent catalytic subunit